MSLHTVPKFNLKGSLYRINPHSYDKFPINPYIEGGTYSKLFRGSKHRNMPWQKLIDELEPYSLYPREEIEKLIRLHNFFIFYYLAQGCKIDVPLLGSFAMHTEEYRQKYFGRHPELGEVSKHDTLVFRPSPFVHWYFNPEQYTPYKYQKVPTYFKAFDKYLKVLTQSGINWSEIFPDKKFLVWSIEKLKCNGTLPLYAGKPEWDSKRRVKQELVRTDIRNKPRPKVIPNPYEPS